MRVSLSETRTMFYVEVLDLKDGSKSMKKIGI